jgi:hypothetical protein
LHRISPLKPFAKYLLRHWFKLKRGPFFQDWNLNLKSNFAAIAWSARARARLTYGVCNAGASMEIRVAAFPCLLSILKILVAYLK